MANVSFIIPHKGREEMLLQTLRSIGRLKREEHVIEIVLVSQNKDASEAILALEKTLPLKVIFDRTGGTISVSRNMGVREAKGEFLAFLDADVELAENWLSEMFATLKKPDVVLASAMQVNGDNPPPLERIRTALSNATLDDAVTFLPGRNLFLSRECFEQVGGFPEHLITCEDYYFTERVASIGKLFYTSKTQYVHIGEDKALKPMFKKEIWRGQSNLASISGRRIPLSEYPSFIVPIIPPVFLILALIFSALGQFTYASIGFAMTVLPVLVYSSRLKMLVGKQASVFDCLAFYITYFPARAIGTVMGLFSSISTSTHK